MRPLKFIIGLLLLPLAWAVTLALLDLVAALHATAGGSPAAPFWWLAGGFLLWLVLFFAMSRPVRSYVLAHELTHAFWGLLMGARVSRLKVTGQGGSVTLSKTNFWVTLAPYFFPFYTACVIVLHFALSFFFDLSAYELFWLGLIGLTWSFHVTFTAMTLLQHQPDIAAHGRVFSYVFIYIMNVVGVGLWIVGVASPTLLFFLRALGVSAVRCYAQSAHALTGWILQVVR